MLVLLGLVFWIPPWLRATVGETGDGPTPPDDAPREALASDGEFTTAKLLEAPHANLTTANALPFGKDVVVLTTTILGKTHRAAVVNGRLHREGDRIVIAGETFRLASVAEDRIELQTVGSHSAIARSLIIRRAALHGATEMIASFRSRCIFALGSTAACSWLATALARRLCRHTQLSAATGSERCTIGVRKALPESSAKQWQDEAEPSPPPTAATAPLTISSSEQSPIHATAQTPSPRIRRPIHRRPSQNATRLRSSSAPEANTDQPTSSMATKTAALPAETTSTASSVTRPVVALKPQERLLASLDNRLPTSAAPADRATGDLVTRIYHPNTTSVADLQRLDPASC